MQRRTADTGRRIGEGNCSVTHPKVAVGGGDADDGGVDGRGFWHGDLVRLIAKGGGELVPGDQYLHRRVVRPLGHALVSGADGQLPAKRTSWRQSRSPNPHPLPEHPSVWLVSSTDIILYSSLCLDGVYLFHYSVTYSTTGKVRVL